MSVEMGNFVGGRPPVNCRAARYRCDTGGCDNPRQFQYLGRYSTKSAVTLGGQVPTLSTPSECARETSAARFGAWN